MVAVVLVPRELFDNILTVCCCVAAFGRVKISTVSVVLLCAETNTTVGIIRHVFVFVQVKVGIGATPL